MIRVYLNYPVARISVHTNPGCTWYRPIDETDQRTMWVTPASFSSVIGKFLDRKVRFAATKEYNDLWLEINFGNRAFEMAVLRYIVSILERRYTPFGRAEIQVHCES